MHNFVDLGIAVDLDYQGLLVPVVRSAETKRLRALAHEINDLAGRAKARKLRPDEISGGTFTISNNGSAGSVLTMAIINQPQVAILSTDAIVRKPVVVDLPGGGEGIAIHPVGNLAMSWDHRAFDGAYAAGFLVRVKEMLETRDWDSRALMTRRRAAARALARARPYREALAVQEAMFQNGTDEPPAAARAPARVHPRAARRSRHQRARRSGRGRRRAGRASTAAATSPTTVRVSSSATRSCPCHRSTVASGPADTVAHVTAVEQLIIDTLAELGVPNAGRLPGYPGVWVDAERRGAAQDLRDRRARVAWPHDARLRAQRRHRHALHARLHHPLRHRRSAGDVVGRGGHRRLDRTRSSMSSPGSPRRAGAAGESATARTSPGTIGPTTCRAFSRGAGPGAAVKTAADHGVPAVASQFASWVA